MSAPSLTGDLGKDLEKLDAIDVPITLGGPEAVQLVALVQLVLRHPNLPPTSRAFGRQFCDGMIEALEQAVPGVGDFLRLGDNPDYDVPADESGHGTH